MLIVYRLHRERFKKRNFVTVEKAKKSTREIVECLISVVNRGVDKELSRQFREQLPTEQVGSSWRTINPPQRSRSVRVSQRNWGWPGHSTRDQDLFVGQTLSKVNNARGFLQEKSRSDIIRPYHWVGSYEFIDIFVDHTQKCPEQKKKGKEAIKVYF